MLVDEQRGGWVSQETEYQSNRDAQQGLPTVYSYGRVNLQFYVIVMATVVECYLL